VDLHRLLRGNGVPLPLFEGNAVPLAQMAVKGGLETRHVTELNHTERCEILKQESLADAKVSARQQCVYEDPYRRNLQQICN